MLPNASVVYAQTAAKIPVIGQLVEVFTLRNYFYSDDKREMDITVPKVSDQENSEAAERINMNMDELTHDLVGRFYDEVQILGEKGYGSIYVDYDAVTNTDSWFTLKLSVTQISGSSNAYYKYYHIDRRTGSYVELSDLFKSEEYRNVITENIKEQMRTEMQAGKDILYYVDDTLAGEEFTSIDKNQNFYFNDKNELVIVFDKYEVAPGFMGCPEFVVGYPVIAELLKENFSTILKK